METRNTEPRQHTAALAMQRRLAREGVSVRYRVCLACAYVAGMNKDNQRAYGEGRLTDAQAIQMAEGIQKVFA